MGFLQKLFSDHPSNAIDEVDSGLTPEMEARISQLEHSSKAQLAAQLLRAPTALMRLTLEEATAVVSYMRPGRLKMGTVFIHEGDTDHNDYMLLILEGEVTVETHIHNHSDSTLNVLGPGSLIGELALLDGEPRYATCTASTDLLFARLLREDFSRLLNEAPPIGCKLLLAICNRLTERLRDTSDKLKVSNRLIQTLQQELDQAMTTSIFKNPHHPTPHR